MVQPRRVWPALKREAENETAASGADDHHAPEATLPYGDIVNNVNMK
jgi:hypothetical protein